MKRDFKFPCVGARIQSRPVGGDRAKLPERVTAAEAAIRQRMRAIFGRTDGDTERQAIGKALSPLSQLRTFFDFFALIFVGKACVFIESLPENGGVETNCLPFDIGLLAVCR
jgi:hypothetical protein